MDSAEYQERKKRLRIYCILFAILPVPGYLIYVSLSARYIGMPRFNALILYTLFALISIQLAVHFKKKSKELSGPTVSRVLSKSFDSAHYQPLGFIEKDLVRASRLFAGKGFTFYDMRGSDLIVGCYRGVRFRFSNLTFPQTKYKTQNVAFFVLEHQGKVNGRILVKETETPWYKSVENASGGFKQRFEITADDRESAPKILTSSFKRQLVQTDRAVHTDTTLGNPRLDICIDADHVYIALWNRQYFSNAKAEELGEIESAAQEGCRELTAFLDAFLDHPVLFPWIINSDAQHSGKHNRPKH